MDDDSNISMRFVKDSSDRSLADKLAELYIESGNYEKAIETALATLNWRRQNAMHYMLERSALVYLGIAYSAQEILPKLRKYTNSLLAQSQLKNDPQARLMHSMG